jgi:hypothetical protein
MSNETTYNHPAIGNLCIYRCSEAGVHMGTLEAHDGTTLTVTGARRIWSWRGALSLSEVSQRGVESARLGCEVPTLYLRADDVCEVIPTTCEIFAAIVKANTED